MCINLYYSLYIYERPQTVDQEKNPSRQNLERDAIIEIINMFKGQSYDVRIVCAPSVL